MVQGLLHRERCLLDTGRPPGVCSQAPGIRGSTWVIPHDRDTRGIKMQNEQKYLKTDLDETPPSVATPWCGERPVKQEPDCLEQKPSETAQFQVEKPHVKYSCTVRRRLRRQRQKERQKAERAAFLALSSASTTGGVGATTTSTVTTGLPVSLKRVKTELDASDYSNAPSAKRFKVDDQEPFSQTPCTVTLAIVPMDYPDRRLDADEVDSITNLIKLRILSLPNDTKAPTFNNTWTTEGALIFSCTDKQTAEWIANFTSEIILKDNVQVHVLPADELIKCHRIIVHVEDPGISIGQILEFLDKQNKGLAAREWIITSDNENRDAARCHFFALVNNRTLEILRSLNFKLFCGLGQARVNYARKKARWRNMFPKCKTESGISNCKS